MNKTKETAIIIVSFLLIPVSLLAVYLTGGDILPRIKTLPQQTWNIQDIPLIVIAFIGAVVSHFGFKMIKKLDEKGLITRIPRQPRTIQVLVPSDKLPGLK